VVEGSGAVQWVTHVRKGTTAPRGRARYQRSSPSPLAGVRFRLRA
jgi:hypothetical protein